ncbi:GNAT family N-acetyltransferase [Celerinatantimonas sp. MCCC 1A17872]|uniref:GNAT family N-acetyltransferase n=1 Tax=Celerinatantimonas sp. MCCC 1A17872 TaxID=3177514 RepID=UPI0038C362D3
MNLITKRLILRKPNINDLCDFYRIYADPATNVFNPKGPIADINIAHDTLQQWINQWEQQGYGMWAISSLEAQFNIVGFGGFTQRQFAGQHILNLGYRFAIQAWGKGYATEATKAMLQMGFEQCQLKLINATVRINHHASQKVLQKAGFVYDKTVRDEPHVLPAHVYQYSLKKWQIEHLTHYSTHKEHLTLTSLR